MDFDTNLLAKGGDKEKEDWKLLLHFKNAFHLHHSEARALSVISEADQPESKPILVALNVNFYKIDF